MRMRISPIFSGLYKLIFFSSLIAFPISSSLHLLKTDNLNQTMSQNLITMYLILSSYTSYWAASSLYVLCLLILPISISWFLLEIENRSDISLRYLSRRLSLLSPMQKGFYKLVISMSMIKKSFSTGHFRLFFAHPHPVGHLRLTCLPEY
ncbi:hypothetical protein ES703_83250 [subsurface metagenome]